MSDPMDVAAIREAPQHPPTRPCLLGVAVLWWWLRNIQNSPLKSYFIGTSFARKFN